MNISSAVQSGLVGANRTNDNSIRPPSDNLGAGRPAEAQEASGREAQSTANVRETTVNRSEQSNRAEQSNATTVVSDPTATIGVNIDTRV